MENVRPWCVCCGDAYGSRRMCAACRRDPANDGWTEASRMEVSVAEVREPDLPPGEWMAPRRVPPKNATRRAIQYGVWLGFTDAQMASALKISRARVGRVRRELAVAL